MASEQRRSDDHPLVGVLRQVTAASCPGRFNFHCHSLCSDGSLEPEAIADQAVALGLEHFAVTDHHSLEAVPRVQARLAGLAGEGMAVPTLWPGTEISCLLETCLVHVLALGIDGHHPAMAPYLQGDTVSGPALQASAVVEAIQAAGGLALLAHPARYRLGFRPLLEAAAALGFDGAEVWYDYEMQEHWRPSPHVCEAISRLCGDLDLLQSCGTDSHGMSLKGR
jgi:predicted metal-dependent phosphoesterase TrpH